MTRPELGLCAFHNGALKERLNDLIKFFRPFHAWQVGCR
jgi:hypothetical protein